MGGYDILHRRTAIDGLCRCQLYILLGTDALLESGIYFGAYVALDDIPHLCLSCTAVTFHGKPVVRVHLYGQILTGVDELHQ